MKQRSVITSIASPLRLWPQRLLFVLAVLGGLALAIADKNDALILNRTKIFVLDFMAPVFSALSAPVVTAQRLVDNVGDYLSLRETNRRLQQENLLLLQWQQIARDLRTENDNLRKLMQFHVPPTSSYITAPVVAEARGGFLRSVIVLAGSEQNVAKGQAVLSDYGLVGRVSDVGNKVSRILLLTDINSRLPVFIGRTGSSAILSGTGKGLSELILVSEGADVKVDDLLVTSGAGGVLPQGLPVGKVVAIEEGRFKVQLYADLDRLSYVRIVDYGLRAIMEADLPPLPDEGQSPSHRKAVK